MQACHSILIILIFGILNAANAQIIATNKGDTLYVGPNLVFTVEGGFLNQAQGKVFNEGEMYVQDTLYNTAGNSMFFNHLPGKVYLYGNNQIIGGTDPILFYDLILQNNATKEMDNDEYVENSLNLNDARLLTRDKTMYVTNPDPNAILRNTGYVSSLANGYLQRSMNQNSAYLFPTGEPNFYRPIILTPSYTDRDSFGVRFASIDATTESFDRNQKDTALCLVNPDYYHWIRKSLNNNLPAQIEMFFDPADPVHETMTHWNATGYWENMEPIITGPNSLTKNAWLTFDPVPFAFALKKPVAQIQSINTDYCSNDAPVTLTGIPAGGVFQGNGISGNTFDPSIAGAGSHTILYIYTAPNACMDTTSITLNVRQAPNPQFNLPNVEICDGQSYTLQLPNTYTSYQWFNTQGTLLGTTNSLTVSQTGSYYVVVDSNQCTATSDTVNLLVKPNPNPFITPDRNINLCAGETVVLDAGTGYNSYQWFMNGTPSGQTSQTISVTTAGTYTVLVDSNGCQSISPPITITVRDLPVATISVNGPLNFCEGKDSVILTSSPAQGYLWTPTGEQTQSIVVKNSGTYEVTITDSCGTSTSQPVTVQVYQNPVADFITEPSDTALIFEPVIIQNQSSNDVIQWLWDFGNGQTSQDQNPTVTYEQGGWYTISLTVNNANCQDTISKSIYVDDEAVLFVPNAFTPNKDMLNDNWGIYGRNITEFKVLIYSRWGLLVFESNSLNVQWDGSYNGVPVPEDVYTYAIYATTRKGKKIKRLGTVTVIR